MNKLLLLIPLFLFGCGDNDFRKVEKLEGFRILAIEADPPEVAPEVAPNVSSTLTLFVFDSIGRTVNGTVTSCIDPGIALGAPVACPTGIPSPISFSTTGLTRGAGAPFSISRTVPSGIFTGRLTRDQFNGVGYITIFSFIIDGKPVTAFKRIVATTRTGPNINNNPTSNQILLNDSLFAGSPKKGDTLTLLTSPPENYDFINLDGTTESRREELQVAWFITDGEFDKPKSGVSESVEITKDTPPSNFLILGIVRDDRGGVAIVRKDIGP